MRPVHTRGALNSVKTTATLKNCYYTQKIKVPNTNVNRPRRGQTNMVEASEYIYN